MSIPQPTPSEGLRRNDVLLLAGFCVLLYSLPIALNPLLSTHESVHCQNCREMLAGGDWLIPHYGGRVWLERPPLPHWLTLIGVVLSGHPEMAWGYRLSTALAGLGCALLVGWLAGRAFGRTLGLLAGLAMVTLRETFAYALGPECDIFLCLLVTTALTAFARCEFFLPPPPKPWGWFGPRPWPFLVLFVLLGLANMAKGLFFGTSLILVPMAGYLLWNRLAGLSKYVWGWGILAFLAAGLFWPITTYLRYPEVTELWRSDYLGRLNQGYYREAWWYYGPLLLQALLPWSPAALVGLAVIARTAWKQPGVERFLVCWAVLPVLFLSIPQGKHHHYLLPCLAAWAVLAAVGAQYLWRWLMASARVLHWSWSIPVLLTAAGDLALIYLDRRLPGQVKGLPALMLVMPVLLGGSWFLLTRPKSWIAAAGLAASVLLLHWGFFAYGAVVKKSYGSDYEFVLETRRHAADGTPVAVLNARHPVDASWILFYLPDGVPLLHNASYLHDERLPKRLYVVAKHEDKDALAAFGAVRQLARSQKNRAGRFDGETWALFELCYAPHIWRGPAPTRMTPMQGTCRADGPYLKPPSVLSAR